MSSRSEKAPAHAAKKSNKSPKTAIFIILIILLIGVMGFSGYMFFSTYIPQQMEQNRFAELRDLIGDDDYGDTDPSSPSDSTPGIVKVSKYDKLFSMNEDMRGWLKVDDTQIDYPVLKNDSENGEYYLHRDFDGDYSFAGCLFIGTGCDVDSDIFIIYGHNMLNGSMFGGMSSYLDSDYAKKHSVIKFDTKTERREYRVFSVFLSKAYTEEDQVFKYYENVGKLDEDTYNSILDQYYSMSSIWMDNTPKYRDQILLLSTCNDYTENGRLIVVAYRIK